MPRADPAIGMAAQPTPLGSGLQAVPRGHGGGRDSALGKVQQRCWRMHRRSVQGFPAWAIRSNRVPVFNIIATMMPAARSARPCYGFHSTCWRAWPDCCVPCPPPANYMVPGSTGSPMIPPPTPAPDRPTNPELVPLPENPPALRRSSCREPPRPRRCPNPRARCRRQRQPRCRLPPRLRGRPQPRQRQVPFLRSRLIRFRATSAVAAGHPRPCRRL